MTTVLEPKTAKTKPLNADELKKIDEQIAEIRETGGQADPGEWRQIMDSRRKVMETAPAADDAAKQLESVLTPEQLKQFQDKREAIEKERQQMRERMGGGLGGQGAGRRGGGGGGGGGANQRGRGGQL